MVYLLVVALGATVAYVAVAIAILAALTYYGRFKEQPHESRLPVTCPHYKPPIQLPWLATTNNIAIRIIEGITLPVKITLGLLSAVVYMYCLKRAIRNGNYMPAF